MVMSRIKDVVIKTCIAHEPQITGSYSRCTKNRNVCFEIYGFDILLDSKLRPHLLEINISPSLSSSSTLDKIIKTTLITDTLNLIGVTPYDRKTYDKEMETVMKKRLLGLDKQSSSYKYQQGKLLGGGLVSSSHSPAKFVNGAYQYSKDRRINTVLNSITQEESTGGYRDGLGSTFGTSNMDSYAQLTEEQIQIIIDYEEEQSRLGNFERIFPLTSNCQYYQKFFEHARPSNDLLVRYLKLGQQISNATYRNQGSNSPTLKRKHK